jgi:hypothetical protein
MNIIVNNTPSALVIDSIPKTKASKTHRLIRKQYIDNIKRAVNKILSNPIVEIIRGLNTKARVVIKPNKFELKRYKEIRFRVIDIKTKQKKVNKIGTSIVTPKKMLIIESKITFNGEVAVFARNPE